MKNLLILISFFLIACVNKTEKPDDNMAGLSVNKALFGTMPDGTEVYLFSLQNSPGTQVGIITYGGIVQSLEIAGRDDKTSDVVLGHENLEGYLEANPYFGGIIGRYGNRIAKGQFEINGHSYQLATNNEPNHLHGGNAGFDKRIWQASEVEKENVAGVRLTYRSVDGEEGYPGNLDVTVSYLLRDDDSLEIIYEAETDQTTIINLTNHSYFNLNPENPSILGHELMINAEQYIPVDSTLIPTGELSDVAGTPFDFISAEIIGSRIEEENEQLKLGGGYDHCWVLNRGDEEMSLAAELYDPDTGRLMRIYTTEPGIQFYSGNFLDGTITGKNGDSYPFRSGLCLETQHYPDSPNRPEFPKTMLNPGEKYISRTRLDFSVRE